MPQHPQEFLKIRFFEVEFCSNFGHINLPADRFFKTEKMH